MTLTVVVGSSGSGKTTFLNDTTKSHKCTYVRQYHNLRPYIKVSKIPNFDPTRLPYWSIYQTEGKARTIQVGGTISGEFTAGLSGGQRKLLIFELICQRTAGQSDLLLVFDEPFAGVTDDFVPFIVRRLNELRLKHNILLVTNDHIETLKKIADNTIVVSAIDRNSVQINGVHSVNREKAILALSVGQDFVYQKAALMDELRFFFDVEVVNNGTLISVLAFTSVFYALFLATYWNSSTDSGPLIIVAACLVSFLCLNPYVLSLPDWRIHMNEEAEALLSSSKAMNNTLKSLLTLLLIVIISIIEWALVIAVVDGFRHVKFWVAILMDSVFVTLPFIYFGLYTNLSFQSVDIFASMPFLFMIFYSTTFSPGSGVPIVKELRYLFPRFYLWCMIPSVQDSMEGCPDSNVTVLYMVLTGVLGLVLFLVYEGIKASVRLCHNQKSASLKNKLKDDEFKDLQIELYGTDYMTTRHDGDTNSEHSKRNQSTHPSLAEVIKVGDDDEEEVA